MEHTEVEHTEDERAEGHTEDERAELPFFLPHHPHIAPLPYIAVSAPAPPSPPRRGKFDGIMQVHKVIGGAAFLAILARLQGDFRAAVTVGKEAVTVGKVIVTLATVGEGAVKEAVTLVKEVVTVGEGAVTVGKEAVFLVKEAVTVGEGAVTVGKEAVFLVKEVVTVGKEAVTSGKKAVEISEKALDILDQAATRNVEFGADLKKGKVVASIRGGYQERKCYKF